MTLAKNRSSYFKIATSSQTRIQLAWWYLSILIPSLVFKYLCLRYIIHAEHWDTFPDAWDFSEALDSLGGSSEGIGPFLGLFFVFQNDFVEVFILVMVVFIVGHLMFHVRGIYLLASMVFACMLVGGANLWFSREVGSLLTPDALTTIWNWVREEPGAWREFLTPQAIVFVPFVILWSFVSIALTNLATGSATSFRSIQGYFQLILLVVVITSALLPDVAFPRITRGYWSSTIISFLNIDRSDLRKITVPTPSRLQADYWNLSYPEGRPPNPDYLMNFPEASLKPRHILLVLLETAPSKYYPIINDPNLSTFYEMSKHAIVSDKHHSTRAFSTPAVFSILSGAYARRGESIADYGDFETDGLASVLAQHGYETTYFDSFIIDWDEDFSISLRNLGFVDLIDNSGAPRVDRNTHEIHPPREKKSFEHAFERILDAEKRGTKSLVLIATTIGHIGHFPFNEKAIYSVNKLFDKHLGTFLQSLQEHGLGDDVLIVVTGDHGLRFRREFESLHEDMHHRDLTFNVPFLLYAPALFKTQIRLPYVTSHVDITPTLLELIGIPIHGLLFHGENMLDQRLKDRISFMMHDDSSFDSFYWKGNYFTVNHVTGKAHRNEATKRFLERIKAARGSDDRSWSDQKTRGVLERAHRVFDETAAYFLQRKVKENQNQKSDSH